MRRPKLDDSSAVQRIEDFHVTLTATGIVLPAQMGAYQWELIGKQLLYARRAAQWAWGDWWAYGAARGYGERKKHIVERWQDGPQPQTLANWGSVARAFATSRRREPVPFSHHAEVAGMSEQDADRLLDWCESRMRGKRGHVPSISALRAEIRDRRRRGVLPILSGTRKPPAGYAEARRLLISEGHHFERTRCEWGDEMGVFVGGALVDGPAVVDLAAMPTEQRAEWLATRRFADKSYACRAVLTFMEGLHVSFEELAAAIGAAKEADRQPPMAASDRIMSDDIAKEMACYEAYKMFKDDMATIAEANYASDQLRVTAILGAVILLVSHDLPTAHSFHALHALFTDIYDLAFGGRPAFFFQAKKPPGVSTKPKIAYAHTAQGLLAIAYAALVISGGKKPAKAIQWLNDALKTWSLSSLVSGEDIQGWYHQCGAKHGRPAPMLVEAFQAFRPELSNLSSPAEAEAFAKRLLMTVAIGKPSRSLKLRS
jgi:hypothetical protein